MGINRLVRLSVLVALLGLMLVVPVSSFAGVFISVGFGPPALPVYVQPPCPGVGYMWTPGYWAYGPNGYFWVPGTWVMAPQPGLLWTPGYWGWGGSAFLWHAGYWGPRIGFYGGVNYGYGYGGVGYQGGYWRGREFFYNRSVNNIEHIHVTNVYNTRVIENGNHVAFNGGRGGIEARATAEEERAAREKHFAPTAMQTRHETGSASNRQLWASENHGRPAIAATARPGEFSGRGVVAAKAAGAPYKAPAQHGAATAHNSVPRPPQTASKQASPRIEKTSRPAAVPRPTNAPRENVSRPSNVPRTGTAPRAVATHSNAAPRAQSTPRPQAQSRPAPRSEPHGEGHPKGQR